MDRIKTILSKLKSDYGYVGIERCLELPFGTFSKWEKRNTKKIPKDGQALLKMINAFPWLIEVADAKFDEFEAKRIMTLNGINMAFNVMKDAKEKKEKSN